MKIFKFLQLSLIVVMLASCSKVELQEVPPHLITSETLYTNYAGFDAGINGVYALIRQTDEGLNGGSSLTSDLFRLGTDNLVSNHQVSPFNVVTTQWVNTNNSTNEFYANAFSWLYNIVNACNTIIAKAENPDVVWGSTTGNATQNKQYVLANAKAARAWAYRHLTFLWGDVPLNLELKLEVWDSPNSAGVVIDAIRCCKLALDKGISGALTAPSSYFMKSPPIQYSDDEAHRRTEEFISANAIKGEKKVAPKRKSG